MTKDEMYAAIIAAGQHHNLSFLREYAVPFLEPMNDPNADAASGKIDLVWFNGDPVANHNARTPVALFEIEGADVRDSLNADFRKFHWSPARIGAPKVIALFSNRDDGRQLHVRAQLHNEIHQAAQGIDVVIDQDFNLDLALDAIFQRALLAH